MDFAHYWQYTDIVTKSLFFILLGLSLISWVVGLTRLSQSQKLATTVTTDLTEQVHSKQATLSTLPFEQQKTVIEQTLLQHLNRYRFNSEKGLSILGTTAAIAPFVGLFGTVWGIFHALHSIAGSGQAGLAQVAGPVGESLIMTGLGLAVAIPAVVFYNIAVRLNRKALHLANDKAHELLATSLISPKSATLAPAVQKTTPPAVNNSVNLTGASA